MTLRGEKLSPETRARIGQAVRKFWAEMEPEKRSRSHCCTSCFALFPIYKHWLHFGDAEFCSTACKQVFLKLLRESAALLKKKYEERLAELRAQGVDI